MATQMMLMWVVMAVVVVTNQQARSDPQTLPDEDAGEPLFLTPLLQAGQYEEARRLSRTRFGDWSEHSHSGFLTVNQGYHSNLFFWFFPAQEKPEDAPLILWQEGGPGTSSLFSLFNQHGPFLLDDTLTLMPRNYSWTKTLNMLYIDAPAGAGLSFTEHELGYASDAATVARELYEALTQFLQLFPHFRGNNLFLAGIGEGGKHTAALALHIHQHNPTASIQVNLKGIAIGNGARDPARLIDQGELFYHLSFFDVEERDYFQQQTDLLESLVQQHQWLEAFKVRQRVLGEGWNLSYFANVTDNHNLLNLMEEERPEEMDRWEQFIALPEVRGALHLGSHTVHDKEKVKRHMREEVMKSIEPWIVEVMLPWVFTEL